MDQQEQEFYNLLLPQATIPADIKIKDGLLVTDKIGNDPYDFDSDDFFGGGRYAVVVFFSGASHAVSEKILTDFAAEAPNFESANCRLLAVTKASMFTLEMWLSSVAMENGIPVVADQKEEIIRPFGVLHRDSRLGHPANSVFIIDGNKRVRYCCVLEPTVLQDPKDVLSLVKEFQATDDGKHLCMSGGQVIENTMPAIKEFFNKSFKDEDRKTKSIREAEEEEDRRSMSTMTTSSRRSASTAGSMSSLGKPLAASSEKGEESSFTTSSSIASLFPRVFGPFGWKARTAAAAPTVNTKLPAAAKAAVGKSGATSAVHSATLSKLSPGEMSNLLTLEKQIAQILKTNVSK